MRARNRFSSLCLLAAMMPWTGACSTGKTSPAAPVPVSGRVVAASGKAVVNMLISFHGQAGPQAGNRYSDVLDKDGRFKVNCVPGQYKVTLAPIPASRAGAEAGGELTSAPGKDPDPKKATKGIPRAYLDAQDSPWQVNVPPDGELTLTVK